MKKEYFFDAKRLKEKGIILKAAKHNLRQIQRELGAASHISAHLMGLNEVIEGPKTADEVAELANSLMIEAGIGKVKKLRRDSVLGLEAVFSLPLQHGIDDTEYFKHCLRWSRRVFGCVILSAVIHRDESNPHLHVLMLPLINGSMVGSGVYGTKAKIWGRWNAFYDDVAASYGFEKPQQKMKGHARGKAADEVIKVLEYVKDPAIHSTAWQAIRKSIQDDPRPYMEQLGMAKPKEADWQRIMKSNGKGAKVEKADYKKPIGFDGEALNVAQHTPTADTHQGKGANMPH